MSIILKADLNGEIRRVGLNQDEATVEKLEAKLRSIFPQLDDSFLITSSNKELDHDEAVVEAFSEASASKPHLLRVRILPIRSRTTVPLALEPEYIQIPSAIEPQIAPEPESVGINLFSTFQSTKPTKTKIFSTGRECQMCRVPLDGVHFKCLNCLDFEVCPQCEENQAHVAHHLFVKLRVPVDTLPLKTQLIFKRHLESPIERELARDEKKQLREMARKNRVQEKLRRSQMRLEKKNKLTPSEKKKATAISKVKRAKKIPAVLIPIELQPTQSEKLTAVEPTAVEPTVPQTVEVTETKDEKEEEAFNMTHFISEFQVLKQETVSQEDVKPDIELQVIQGASEEQAEPKAETPEVEAAPEKETPFAKNLKILEDMGFTDREKNIELLVRHVGNLDETINQLLNPQPPQSLASFSKWLPFSFGL